MSRRDDDKVCPRFHRTVEMIGRRWTGAILQSLFAGSARFTELKERIPELSDRLLSERLKELEELGLVEREVEGDRPVSVHYVLTAKGRSLRPVMDSIAVWADRWMR